ncbi:nucleotide-binding protein, partial [Patescibacteria group bacterium]|nr:nucleotide-binding protein [Patescibacteria group bacterium]
SRKSAITNSVFKPDSFSKVFEYYKGKKVPEKNFFANTLVRDFGIPKKQATVFVKIFMTNMKYLGLINETTTGPWFASERSSSALQEGIKVQESKETGDEEQRTELPVSKTNHQTPQTIKSPPNAIFLGHGKNEKPLNQLIKILDEYKIPHKEAIAEPNAGRPISTKVADTMRECGAAILIFTADEKFKDEEDNEIWRPSENVAHELGAASVLYDNKIVIFKEDEVSLASNFSGVGYISFKKDKLNDKAGELFRELVEFKLLSFTVGG